MTATPLTLREANAFIAEHHRHHKPSRGCICVVGASVAGVIVGVATIGRPTARGLQDGWTAEVNRLATDGTRNACSFLYGCAWRAVKALGYKRLVTYTLPEEGGSSLRGAGFTLIGEAGGGSWSRKSRPRVDTHPMQLKLRWQRTAEVSA